MQANNSKQAGNVTCCSIQCRIPAQALTVSYNPFKQKNNTNRSNQSSFSLSSSATTSDTDGTPMEFSCFCRMPAQCSAVLPETTWRSDLDCNYMLWNWEP